MKKMDGSALDFVAQMCMDLTEAISTIDDDTDRDSLIINHIKKVWSTVPAIKDFRKNMEWFNVTEPISLSHHCSEKIVLLDFWTYCCINCYHVLADLAHLEKLYKVDDGLAVIGVHCAKFTNEQESANVLSAVQRYNIHHPVVNDANSSMWEMLGIRCWPTMLILGPGNKPIFVLTGEGHRDELIWYIGAALRHFSIRISNSSLPIEINKHVTGIDEYLNFPGKIALNTYYKARTAEPYLCIADTGNNRLVLTDYSGIVLRIVGGPEPGNFNGNLADSRFNAPQGICWMSTNVIAVCDTNNHCIRAVHLDEDFVETLAGNGVQSTFGDLGGKCLQLQPLSSPWDIALFTTLDMDMSVRPLLHAIQATTEKDKDSNEKEKEADGKDYAAKDKSERRRVLLIACAGSHQIWALFLDTTIWWKYKSYPEGTCVCVAGTGAEAARNSSYAHSAAFAQPSGLALRLGTSPEMFIADSESSSIRRLALTTGQVTTLCGGDRNPLNLFAFGDVDDIGTEAKLQHPLAIAYADVSKTLFIADTYNHKIKKVDIGLQKVTTLNPTVLDTTEPVKFNEPSGLSMSADGKYLYIADTNNHCIKILNVAKNACQEFKLKIPEPLFADLDSMIHYKNDLFVNKKCGHLIIYFNVHLDIEARDVKFTPGALQNWTVSVREDDHRILCDDFEFVNGVYKGSKLPGRVEMKLKRRTNKTHYRLFMSFDTALCDGDVCFTHTFTIRSSILVRDSVKMVESYKITCKVNPVVKH